MKIISFFLYILCRILCSSHSLCIILYTYIDQHITTCTHCICHMCRMEKAVEYRRSRIPRNERGVASRKRAEDGEEEEGRLRFDQLGLRASQLKLPYYRHSVAGDGER